MYDGIDPVVTDHFGYELTICNFTYDEWRSADRGFVSELHAVEYDDVATSFQKEPHCVRADVAGSAGHENGHWKSIARRIDRSLHSLIERLGFQNRFMWLHAICGQWWRPTGKSDERLNVGLRSDGPARA